MTESPQIDEDAEYSKTLWHYRQSIGEMLEPLRLYGQDAYCQQLVEQMVSLGVQLHEKLLGLRDEPFHW